MSEYREKTHLPVTSNVDSGPLNSQNFYNCYSCVFFFSQYHCNQYKGSLTRSNFGNKMKKETSKISFATDEGTEKNVYRGQRNEDIGFA